MLLRFRHLSSVGTVYLYGNDEMLAGVCFEENRKAVEEILLKQRKEPIGEGENAFLFSVSQQIDEYLAGKRRQFAFATALTGSEFQKKVLDEVAKIPYGESATYGEIAERIGQPKAYRAVGAALNHNPLLLVYPCHRVNARNGMLSGYAGGISVKKKLLQLETVHPSEIVSENELQNPEMTTYIRQVLRLSFRPDLKQYAEEHNVPVAKEETLSFLQWILALQKPAKILEVGTAIGYSTLFLQKCCPTAEITTVEKDKTMFSLAEQNLKESKIHLLFGDAEQVLSSLEGKYDFIFVDAAKGQYLKYYPLVAKLLKSGGVAVYDNVLYKGLSLRGEEVPHKHRTIARNLNLFNDTACHDDRADATILPVGDGVLLWRKK